MKICVELNKNIFLEYIMVYKALLVGVNYYMQKDDTLLSPLNNIELMRDFLISYAHFKDKDIVLLSDSTLYNQSNLYVNYN